jgi:translocation and assembly module TamB
MRRLFRVLLVIVVIVSILGIAGYLYLRSQRVKDQVTAQLQAAYGGSVHVEGVDIGLNSSALSGVKLFEKGKEPSQPPWASVESIHADVSLFALLHGDSTPHNLTLTGADITLRFGKDGKLLTALPTGASAGPFKMDTLPNLRIERGRLTLQREEGPVLEVTGIDAILHRAADGFVLDGTAESPGAQGWGKWTLHGAFATTDDRISLLLKTTQPVHVSETMLAGLPFVPLGVWQEVKAHGITPVQVALHFDLKQKDARYRVELDPRDTTVQVPAIDLDATAASGRVIVEGLVVKLSNVQGKAFGGTIKTNADLDFGGKITDLKFSKVEVQGLDMRRLPKSWGLPTQFEGELKGSAWLEVLLEKGQKPLTRGEGQGEIENARVAGLPTAEPVRLELHAREGGFGFHSKAPAAGNTQAIPAVEPGLIWLLASGLALIQAPPQDEVDWLSGAVNRIYTGIERFCQGVLDVGTGAVRMIPDKLVRPKRQPQEPPRYIGVNLKMQNVDLALFVKGLGLKLPFPIGGRLTFEVKADIPLDTSGDLKTYRVAGTTTVSSLKLADLVLDEVDANIHYTDGFLHLDKAKGQISAPPVAGKAHAAPGTFTGRARLQVIPLGDLTADLTLDALPLARLAALVNKTKQFQGTLSGAMTARVPGNRLQALDAWEATARITSKDATVFGLKVRDSEAELRVREGKASLTEARTRLEGALVTGAATMDLTSPYQLRGNLALGKLDLSSLQRLVPEVRPPVPVGGEFDTAVKFQGSLTPFQVQTTGTVRAIDLRISDLRFQNVHMGWTSDADRLLLKDLRASLYGGTVAGSAAVPLRPAVAGSVDLRLKDLDVGSLAKDLPALPVKIEGKTNGTVKGTISAAPVARERQITMNVHLQAPRMRVQGVPAEQLQGTVDYRQGVVDYRLEGKALGGTFELNGQVPSATAEPSRAGKEGRLKLQSGKLRLLAGVFGQSPGTFPLGGLVDLDIRFRNEGRTFAPVGNGELVLTDVSWGGNLMTNRLQTPVVLTGHELRLNRMTATLGEGLLRAQLVVNLKQLERSWVTLNLDRVDVSRLIAPWPELAGLLQGTLAVQLRGRLGPEWNGGADVLLERGKIAGVDVSEWRMPISWSYAPGAGQGEISLRDSSAQLAMGRATAQATMRWGMGLQLKGQIRFTNVSVRALSRHLGDSSQWASGRLTGRFDFAGSDIRSPSDLTGTLEASMGETQALQAPALQQVAPFIGLSASYTFRNGELSARLARSVFRIQRLALQSDLVQMMVEGNVTLAGRVDLDVTARTGPIGVDLGRLRLLGLRVPATGNIPLTVVMAASSYLSNRVVHLRVTGTLRSPSISIEMGALLTQEAVRFFLGRANLPAP